MGTENSTKTSKKTKTPLNWAVISLMIQNFFIWFIPGVVLLAFSIIVIFILVSAAATGIEIDLYKRMPKGLVSFFGIAYLLSGIALIVSLFIVPEIDLEAIGYLGGTAVICWLLAYIAIKREYKRLSKI